jgi:peptide/nickel transport system permease protein
VLTYIARRLAQAVPVVLLSTVAVFALLRLVPGDPALILAGPDAPPEVVAAVRAEMGLNQPLPVQYLVWLAHVARGDFGRSFISRLPVADLIAQRIPATLELALAAFLLVVLIALSTGVAAALAQRSWMDWVISSLNAVAIAVPNFWLGILVIIVFALVLGWLPPGGQVDLARDLGQGLKSLLLPALTLALSPAASVSRLVRASMLEVLHEDYVRTARAKGLAGRTIVLRHVLRNALVPVVTLLGLQFGHLLGGAVIVESVFAWPGVGRLILDAIANRDYVVVQAALLLLVLVFVFVNLLIDLLYGLLDPRIRLAGAKRGRG